MLNRKPVAPLPTLLTASVAALISGQALAESAGHVSFVSGPVTATTPDGRVRSLQRGEDISSGDRISTGTGRLQIRFSDGGFVALQPNTVFSVDQYVYANRKPEESSLFFNLLRGGMRTITGVIGHINKASYRVKTPVATIGIRGTEYLAEYDGESLHVTVGLGSVQVANDAGNITLISGQSAKVLPNTAPFQTNEQSNVGAPSPTSSGGGDTPGEASQGDHTSGSGGPAGIAAGGGGPLGNGVPLVNVTSNATVLSTTSLGPNNSAPTAATSTVTTNAAPGVILNAGATFDPLVGSLQSVQASGSTVFSQGTLHYNGVENYGNVLSIGEISGGTDGTGNVTVADGTYIPYAVGLNGAAPGASGTAYYTLLKGSTSPRMNGTGSGQLNSFQISIDLSSLLVGLNMDLHMNGDTSDYIVSASGLSPVLYGSTAFSLYTTQVNGPGCTDGCSASVRAGYAGSNGAYLGTIYDITTTNGSNITGAAGLGLVGVGLPSPTSTGVLTSGSGFSLATPLGSTSTPVSVSSGLDVVFNGDGSLSTVTNQGIKVYDNTTSNQPMQFNQLVTLGTVSYGELTNGTSTVFTGAFDANSNPVYADLTLSDQLFVPYIVGMGMSTPQQDQTLTFSAVGGTTPRLNGATGGVLDALNLTLNLGSGLMGTYLQVTMPGSNVYTGQGSQLTGLRSDGSFNLTGINVTGSVCDSAGNSCSANIAGFLSPGDKNYGTEIGAAYQINLPTGYGAIVGSAALSQTGSTNTTTGLVFSAPGDSLMTYTGGGVSELQGTDGSGLLSASSSGSTVASRTQNSSTTADVGSISLGSDGTLEWGRWTSGDVTVYTGTTTVSSTDSAHYVTGPVTPAATMSALTGSATYSLVGKTSPTNGSATGTLDSGSLGVNFSNSTMLVDLQVSIASLGYHVNDTLNFTSGQAGFAGTGLATTGTKGGACGSGCSTNISGFFAGSQAGYVGLGYAINDALHGTTQGAAAFKKN